MEWEYWIATLLAFIILIIYLNPKFRRTVKCYAKYLYFYVHLATICAMGLPNGLKRPGHCQSMLIFGRLLAPASKVLGIEWEIRGAEKTIPHGKSSILIANHQNMYDIIGMLLLWNHLKIRCSAVARYYFFWLWPVGLAMWIGGIIFVKRNVGVEKSKRDFNNAAAELFKNNEKLWVYVEGTRNKNPEVLLPFKKGGFIAAIKHQVPLQPIMFSPFYFIDLKNKRYDSGKVIIEVMDPISTEGLTHADLNDLVAKAYAIMSEKLKQFQNELKPTIDEYKKSIRD